MAPTLVAEQGVNTLTAPALLVAAGDNPQRLRSEGSFAQFAASRRSTHRQASNNVTGSTAADRQANCALHTVWWRVGRRAPGPEFYETSAARRGLSAPDFFLLAELRRCGEPFEATPGELTQVLVRSTGGTTKQLDGLAAAGHVSRIPTPKTDGPTSSD